MKVPFFDYPQLWNKERKELMSIIDATSSNGSFILQSELEDFENQLAEYTGSKFAVGVGNATDAMEIFLQAIGLQEGDEVIVPSLTYVRSMVPVRVRQNACPKHLAKLWNASRRPGSASRLPRTATITTPVLPRSVRPT